MVSRPRHNAGRLARVTLTVSAFPLQRAEVVQRRMQPGPVVVADPGEARPPGRGPGGEAAAVRMARTKDDYPSEFHCDPIGGGQGGDGSAETLRKWVRRAETDAGTMRGVSTQESEQI
jgi:hypothetical protein